ncbi:MAG: hypothetical protein JXB85_01190 [Anaerolineales bacterium]|nr:hypothetical protein [Anaerolineales bacterium]
MILRLDPGSGVRFFARAMLLSQSNFLQAGQDPDSFYLETIQLYSRAIDQAPCLAPAYFFRGEMKWEIGDVHGALADYDRAIKLDSLYARAYVRRARAKARLGDLPAAMDDLEFFLTLPMGKTRNSNVLKNISAYGLQLSRNRPPSAQGEWRQSDL